MMDVLIKLDEIEAFADLMKKNVDALKNEIGKQGKSKKRTKNKTSDLRVKTIAKRARSRLS